jgi:hypothetical protein
VFDAISGGFETIGNRLSAAAFDEPDGIGLWIALETGG